MTSTAPPPAPDADFGLVAALTRLSWANTEAAEQATAKLVPILEATARAADEAARHIQYGRRELLTERQLKIIKDITS